MTAIAAVWSLEGFVIGADSLRTDRNGNDVTTKALKISSLPFKDGNGFAFAWSGSSPIGSFNFTLATDQAHRRVTRCGFPSDAARYFHELGQQMFCELLNTFGGDSLPSDLANSDFPNSNGLFVGYMSYKPLWAEILFTHDSTRFLPPKVEKIEYSPRGFKIFSGSIEVWKIMDAKELTFAPLDLVSAAQETGEYVQRCIEGRYIFPDCRGIGGEVQLVTVNANGALRISFPISD